MKTSSAKSKGRRLCATVRELLLKDVPELQPDDIIVTPSGVTGEDLRLSPLARTIFPIAIECKNQEKLNIWAALEQSETHAKEKQIPVLFFSRNRDKLYVSLSGEKFIELLKYVHELEKNQRTE